MARLAVVSNRVPSLDGDANAGGLVTALKAAFAEGDGLWFGWSGRTARPDTVATISRADGFSLATIDLTDAEIEGYYTRLANRALWPVLHGRLDLVRIDRAAYVTYREVNRRFADSLTRLLGPDDSVWVHDYHLIPLGHELRRLSLQAPLGFFLHTPFPPADTFAALPWAAELVRLFSAYDLIGFQTRACVENFRAALRRHGPGTPSAEGWRLDGGRIVRIEAHPIGIDAGRQAALAASPAVALRAAEIRHCLGGRLGIAGVERLDYSKGLAQRFQALGRLFERHPHFIDRVTLCQIAAPSRVSVPEYRALQAELEARSGRINARFGTLGWTPIHYLNRGVDCVEVAALMRTCRVGLVTPLRDGMNLVAKEYVAAQNPADPGVLVLSRFAGAAERLTDALIVNPYDTGATAEALRAALEMPRVERIRRWRRLMGEVETHDVHRWLKGFLAALAAAHAHGHAYTSSAA